MKSEKVSIKVYKIVYKKDEVFSLKLANELKHHYSELTQHVKDLGVKLNHLYQ